VALVKPLSPAYETVVNGEDHVTPERIDLTSTRRHVGEACNPLIENESHNSDRSRFISDMADEGKYNLFQRTIERYWQRQMQN
jgi:hypothetical protein